MDRSDIPSLLRPSASAAVCLFLGACSVSVCESTDCLSDDNAASKQETLIRTGHEQSGPQAPSNDAGEPVQQISFDGSRVTFAVVSHGCTVPAHFHIEHAIHDDTCSVTLIRDQADLCRRAPAIAELSLPWQIPDSCSTELLTFTNPIVDLTDRIAASAASGRVPRSQ